MYRWYWNQGLAKRSSLALGLNVGISKIQNSISSLARFLILIGAPRVEQPSADIEPSDSHEHGFGERGSHRAPPLGQVIDPPTCVSAVHLPCKRPDFAVRPPDQPRFFAAEG